MLKNISLPKQLLVVIVCVLLFGHLVNVQIVRALYTFSFLFKDFLALFLPFIIFAFITTGILAFKKNAPIVLTVLIGSIFISNALVAMIAYLIGRFILPYVITAVRAEQVIASSALKPWYNLNLSFPLTSEKVLLLSIAVGLFFSFVSVPEVESWLHTIKKWVQRFLLSVFIPLLPIYVLGFLLKIHYEGTLVQLFSRYGMALILILIAQLSYLCWLYLASVGFSRKRAWKTIQNALPSYITAFSTMSSTAALPVSIDCAEKNIGNKPLAEVSMPIMANIHLLGDCMSTPILAMVNMLLFLGRIPNFAQYSVFVFYFCLRMFAASGIPAGGIIVMIPILTSYLGFTDQMLAIITMLYLLMDSFGTAANVMGDGALVVFVHRILQRLKIV